MTSIGEQEYATCEDICSSNIGEGETMFASIVLLTQGNRWPPQVCSGTISVPFPQVFILIGRIMHRNISIGQE